MLPWILTVRRFQRVTLEADQIMALTKTANIADAGLRPNRASPLGQGYRKQRFLAEHNARRRVDGITYL